MAHPTPKTGVLLINLGTPGGPEVSQVRRYLREFLSDPRVVDINPIGRWLLLNLVILPFRPKRSAAAYRMIWLPEGSPLLVHSEALSERVAGALGDDYVVALGMRYGQPSLAAALEQLQRAGANRVVALPLFPQYADATTGSVVARCLELAPRPGAPGAHDKGLPIEVRPPFFDHPGFIEAFASNTEAALRDFEPDFLLMSYHGLPARHLDKAGCRAACDRIAPCPELGDDNRQCYRAQCWATSRALARRLGLDEKGYGVSFQSRLGRTPWIQPYTDQVLARLARHGVRRLAVVVPSFVADCLETLEEIGIAARARWLHLGGKDLRLVPSLNSQPAWVDAVATMIRAREAG